MTYFKESFAVVNWWHVGVRLDRLSYWFQIPARNQQ